MVEKKNSTLGCIFYFANPLVTTIPFIDNLAMLTTHLDTRTATSASANTNASPPTSALDLSLGIHSEHEPTRTPGKTNGPTSPPL